LRSLNMEKIKTFKLTLQEDSVPALYVTPEHFNEHALPEMEDGTTYNLEIVYLTQEEFELLPDFNGF